MWHYITALPKPPHPQDPRPWNFGRETNNHDSARLFLGGLLGGLGDLAGLVLLGNGLDDTDSDSLTL